jgi:hypothetical protein
LRRGDATAALLLALALSLPVPSAPEAAEQPLGFGADLQSAGWRPLLFAGRAPTQFEGIDAATVRVQAVGSSSMLTRSVDGGAAGFRCLAWRWMVEESTLPATDLGRRGGDDRHLLVSLGFAPVPQDESIAARLRRAIARQQAGQEVPGSALLYVWGGAHPRDGWVESPYMPGAGQIRVVEPSPGPRGRWVEVSVDFAADYEARFARPAPPVVELAIGADSDDTGTRTLGRIADLVFKTRC